MGSRAGPVGTLSGTALVLGLLVLIDVRGAASGLRVLVVATVATPSHYIWTNALTEGLLARGHYVVELTSTMPSTPHANRTTFSIGKFWSDEVEFEIDQGYSKESMWAEMKLLMNYTIFCYKFACESQAFKDIVKYLRKDHQTFDVVLVDYAFQEILLGLSALACRPPVIVMTAHSHPVDFSKIMGNPLTPALVPHDSALYQKSMTFTERLGNVLYYLMYVFGEYSVSQEIEEMYTKHFGKDIPRMAELRRDIVLAFVNTHPIIHGARPLVPSIVEVGLLQTHPGKPLPEELKDWLDGAKDGFIFMSLGSVAKSAKIKAEKRRAILSAFASLKQHVLWKFETDDIQSELPPNVRVSKWLPQNDILAHPNIRAFISHCGGLSFQELLYHGVPLVGIPLFADHFSNGIKSEMLGIGKVLQYNDINNYTFRETLIEIINNPKYRENARRLSAVLRDQKETPLERAVWWVEYVARTGGAPHLRSHALELHLSQLYMLDMLAVLVALPLLLIWLLTSLLCQRTRRPESNAGSSHPKSD